MFVLCQSVPVSVSVSVSVSVCQCSVTVWGRGAVTDGGRLQRVFSVCMCVVLWVCIVCVCDVLWVCIGV